MLLKGFEKKEKKKKTTTHCVRNVLSGRDSTSLLCKSGDLFRSDTFSSTLKQEKRRSTTTTPPPNPSPPFFSARHVYAGAHLHSTRGSLCTLLSCPAPPTPVAPSRHPGLTSPSPEYRFSGGSLVARPYRFRGRLFPVASGV